jgi:2-oxoglutarate dehydrogenase E2 component (dihydrolipoamide succinyltransferase)
MATDVVMPQMGESIAEGTIVRWIKHVGDRIDKDEPLFEISTDKVDAEIPSPGAGIVVEIMVKEGETVPVNSVVAVISADGTRSTEGTDGTDGARGTAATANAAAPQAPSTQAPQVPSTPAPQAPSAPAPRAPSTSAPRALSTPAPQALSTPVRSSPLVRKIAKEHGVDIGRLAGTGLNGRVTKHDILSFLEKGPATSPGSGPAATGGAKPAASSAPMFASGETTHVEKLGVMRKKIAEHMVTSLKTSAHVYSAYEVDFWRVEQLRQQHKAAYERAGTKLTYTAFIARAVVDAIREFPIANASIDGENVVYKRDVNLGIAVALEQGLIVPVIRNADTKSMLDLSLELEALAQKAKDRKVSAEDLKGGSFTISNQGGIGGAHFTPIVNRPEVAILGLGRGAMKPVVRENTIEPRLVLPIGLSYDHRVIDGGSAARFTVDLVSAFENFKEQDVKI